MASHVECRPLGVFECELCTLTAPYSYVGQKPPNTQSMPPGGKLCHEGSLHLRQGQIPGPRLVLQFVQQAGVCGPDVLGGISRRRDCPFMSTCCVPGPVLGTCFTAEASFSPAP
eukprot:XP_011528265.1 cysteine-rich DPF motif domain-containing protein 1 isoform X2 [Homo sapiens]